jgi:hypothetical protein
LIFDWHQKEQHPHSSPKTKLDDSFYNLTRKTIFDFFSFLSSSKGGKRGGNCIHKKTIFPFLFFFHRKPPGARRTNYA